MWRIDTHSKCENVCSALHVLVCCTVLGAHRMGGKEKGGLFKSFGFFVDHGDLSEERARRSGDMGCYGVYKCVYVICIECIYAFPTVRITSYEGGKQ